MLIYVNITDRQTDKHIKSIVRNLTKWNFFFGLYNWSQKTPKKWKNSFLFAGGDWKRHNVPKVYFWPPSLQKQDKKLKSSLTCSATNVNWSLVAHGTGPSPTTAPLVGSPASDKSYQHWNISPRIGLYGFLATGLFRPARNVDMYLWVCYMYFSN